MARELSEDFRQAAEDVQRLPERPDNDTLLKLYALYKQATEGDANGPKPGFFDFVNTAKYEAWSRLRGMQSDEAQRKYVELVRQLQA
ncbi:MAG TPA: acyl-CoA-binding protein [Rhodanobacteraceae bacterium]|nr:acyl-CoA-binding protein [Rhodanobacteraceae bacterium]